MRFFLAFMVLFSLPGWALPLPPDVRLLGEKISSTEAKLGELRQKLSVLEQQNRVRAENWKVSTKALVQVGGYPPPLLLAYAVGTHAPSGPGLLAAWGRLLQTSMERDTARLASMGRVWEQVNRSLDDLAELQAQYAHGRGRLDNLEALALRRASLKADALAAQLGGDFAPVSASPPPEAALPVMPVIGRVIRGFDRSRDIFGVTFEAKPAARVAAVRGGNVLFSGPFRDKGGLVIVDGDDGRVYLYVGLETLNVLEHAPVQGGDLLGKLDPVGKPRLYLEVRSHGRPVDPARVLAGR